MRYMRGNSGITVIDVMRDLKIEPTPALTWMVGDAVRNLWVDRTGMTPEKDLRPKTYDKGSHCFAIYPETLRAEIERIIRTCEGEAARQLGFDF